MNPYKIRKKHNRKYILYLKKIFNWKKVNFEQFRRSVFFKLVYKIYVCGLFLFKTNNSILQLANVGAIFLHDDNFMMPACHSSPP